MNVAYNHTTYYKLRIRTSDFGITEEIYNTVEDLENRLRNLKKEIGKEYIKEFLQKNTRIEEINELTVINIGKGIPNEKHN